MDAIFDFLKGSQRKFFEKIIGLESINEHISTLCTLLGLKLQYCNNAKAVTN